MRSEEIGPSLLAAFARVPDVRSRHGRRYPLSALLTLATAAMLAGAHSLFVLSRWGRLQPPEVRRALAPAPLFPKVAQPRAVEDVVMSKRQDAPLGRS